MKNQKLSLVAYSLGLFVAGLVVGICLTLVFKPSHRHRSRDPQQLVERMKNRLSSELSLSLEQAAQIEPILFDQATRMVAIRSSASEQIKQVIRSADEKIIPFLDSTQQSKLRAYRETKEKRRSERKSSHSWYNPS
jgi:hypothetical protein